MAGKKTRIMYLELKSGHADNGPARIARVSFSKTGRIARVSFSKTGRMIYYKGKTFHSTGGQGVSGNYRDVETGEEYWISGPKKNGEDRHWAGSGEVQIDSDVVEEYWRDIRQSEPPAVSNRT